MAEFTIVPLKAWDLIDAEGDGVVVRQNDRDDPTLWCELCGRFEDADEGPCVHIEAVQAHLIAKKRMP